MAVNPIGADILSPAMLVKNLGQSAIQSLTATPDSGFCTPSSGYKPETFSAASSATYTPKNSRVSTRSEHTDARYPVDLNKVFSKVEMESFDQENESPLDRSLHSVQWLQTYTIEEPVKSLTTSPSNQSVTSVQKSSSNNQAWIVQSETPTVANLLTVSVPAVTPLLSLTPVVSGSSQNMTALCNHQERRVLQELDTNMCQMNEKSQYERPSYSYMDLIKMALKHSEDGQMTLREIIRWIEDHFPYFKYQAKQSWKSTIRCNLSLHSDFTRVEGKKRGAKWKIVDGAKSYLHRLPKAPVIKNPIGPKVPAVTRQKAYRSGPLPILPKSVPYALVPLSLATNYQGSQAQHLQQQTLQILQQHQQQLSLQSPELYHKQQRAVNVNTPHQLLLPSPVTCPEQIKPCLQQITPKLQQEPINIVWNPKALILRSHGDNNHSPNAPNEAQPNLCKDDVQENAINIHQNSSDTRNNQKKRTFSRSSTSDHILQPVDIHIHEGSQVNEKKIVFYLKQQQDPQNQMPSGVTAAGSNIHHSTGDTQMPKDHLVRTLRTRSICKTVDKIQRSKSFDVGNRNVQSRPYFRSPRRAPVVNLETLLKEDKQSEGTVEKLLRDGNDEGLVVDFSPEQSVTSRPCSAPTKCLIQQAWDQAGVIGQNECDLVGSHMSCFAEAEIKPDHLSTGLGETACSSVTVPKKFLASDDCVDKENQPVPNPILYHAKGLDPARSLLFQPSDIPESDTNTTSGHTGRQFYDRNYRQAISRNGSTKEQVICQVVSREVKQDIQKNRSSSLESGVDSSVKDWHLQEKQDSISAAADETSNTVSPSKSLSTSKKISSPAASRVSMNSLAVLPSSPSLKASHYGQSTAQCTPQPRFYRTRSRRKQIHTPLTTDLSPDKVRTLSDWDTTASVRNDQLKLCSSLNIADAVSHNITGDNICMSLTPPSGSHLTSLKTSSPNSDNPSPLDFASFLSNLSSSPCLYDDSNTAQSVNWAGEEAIPISSSTPPSFLARPPRASYRIHRSSSSLAVMESSPPSSTSARNSEVNLQDSTALPTSASPISGTLTPKPCHATTDPIFNQNDHFLSSNPFLVSNEDMTQASCGYTLGHFLSLTSTPPSGHKPVSTDSTPTYGMKLPSEMLHFPQNSSGLLDSSLFDNLDSLMQNSLFEFKTP